MVFYLAMSKFSVSKLSSDLGSGLLTNKYIPLLKKKSAFGDWTYYENSTVSNPSTAKLLAHSKLAT